MSKQTINVTTTLGSPTVSKSGFGTMLLLVEAEDTVFATRTKIYSSLSAVAVDFADTTAEYKACQSAFLQVNPPAFIKIGRKESADATYTSALNAIYDYDSDWYFLATMTRTQAEVVLCSTWCETAKKMYVTCESAVAGTIATAIEALGYNHTTCLYHSTANGSTSDVFADVGSIARMSITTPGSTTLSEKSVVGVTADNLTDDQIATLEAVNCSYFVDTSAGTRLYVGKVASGEWFDVIRFSDWLSEEIAYRTMVLKISKSDANSKIPYTSDGITMIDSEISGAFNTGVINGGLSGFQITMPDIADVSTADKLARTLNNTSAVGELAGAILYVNINVNLEV